VDLDRPVAVVERRALIRLSWQRRAGRLSVAPDIGLDAFQQRPSRWVRGQLVVVVCEGRGDLEDQL
jgi:hypothetical protein